MKSATAPPLDESRADEALGNLGPHLSVRGELVGFGERVDPRTGQAVRVAILATGGWGEGLRRLVAGLAFVAAALAALALAGLVLPEAWPPTGLVRTAFQLGLVVVPLMLLSPAMAPALSRTRAVALAVAAAAGHAVLLVAWTWLAPGHATLAHWVAAHPLIALWAWVSGTVSLVATLRGEGLATRLGARIELPLGTVQATGVEVADLGAGLEVPPASVAPPVAVAAEQLESAARR